MKILIVDDSVDNQLLLQSILKQQGYDDLVAASSASEAFNILEIDNESKSISEIDLVLMDIMMPELDGIEACRKIKESRRYKDVPIIMVTAKTEENDLKAAFDAGAMDYITKPFKKVELLVRIRSALRLKYEMDWRKIHEEELLKVKRKLEEANKRLKNLSSLDGLTGIANRRSFDEYLHYAWRNAARNGTKLSLIMVDIDFFKAFNDTYGHQAGDDCLKRVASTLNSTLNRAGDLVARYGGEEFAVITKGMTAEETGIFAEKLRARIEEIGIVHANSSVCKTVTISLGAVSTVPIPNSSFEVLIETADNALYKAKQSGRNKVESVELILQEE